MDLKEQTRALLLLRRWLEMADKIGGANRLTSGTIRAVAELAADTSSFLVLEVTS
jgi:hypothetical protein